MMKALKVPEELIVVPFYQRELKLNGLNVLESCTHTQRRIGSMYLEDHMLMVVLEGTNTLTLGKRTYVLNKGEMILLNKSILVSYDKKGSPDNGNIYESMLFFLKEDCIVDFLKMTEIKSVQCPEKVHIQVKPVKECLLRFFDSLKPYFNEPEKIEAGLIRIKMLELLYDISISEKNLFQQLLQLKQQVYGDITSIVEENYSNPVSLQDLAYLSGRSLSSFKRDFQAIYQIPPARWIREKRLNKAKELLEMTELPIKDIGYSLGFENMAHFSRLFKEYFGYSPSQNR
jgi:AraC-like DNA-binding protein